MPERKETGSDLFRAALNAIPFPVLVVDGDLRIVQFNTSASPLFGPDPGICITRRGGDAMHCLHSLDAAEGCGRGEYCRDCTIRNSVRDSLHGRKVIRRPSHMELRAGNQASRSMYLLITTSPIAYDRGAYVLLILEDISEMIELKSILPMCANCKGIRDEQEYWSTIEAYFKKTLDVEFTHGICPTCYEKLYPELLK